MNANLENRRDAKSARGAFSQNSFRPSLSGLVDLFGNEDPAMNRRAIFGRPCGTGKSAKVQIKKQKAESRKQSGDNRKGGNAGLSLRLNQSRHSLDTTPICPAVRPDRIEAQPRLYRLNGFSLIEVLVVVSLLSLMVLALMVVFSNTQRAFRAAVTQTDVLEGGRATMDLMAADLRGLTPSDSGSVSNGGAVNLMINDNANYSQPLVQALPGSSFSRSNLLQEVYILNHQNNGWWGVGYAVALNSSGSMYSLYRLQFPSPPGVTDPSALFSSPVFQNFFANPTNGGSHLLDGVVHFVVRAYDPNGTWISSANLGQIGNPLTQTGSSVLEGGETGLAMYSNNVPAAVEVELGVLEDRALARAESLPTQALQTNYLWGQAGAVHLFRQRVTIPNVDNTAYQ